MKNKILIIALAISLFACERANRKGTNADYAMKTDSMSGTTMKELSPPPLKYDKKNPVSSSAAVVKAKDSNRKVIRTADLKFQVKNAIKATYAIEDIVDKYDGFVTYTNLSSNINNQTVTPVSEDSSVESTYYNVTNTMTIRVPNTKLDTMLKAIAVWIDFLDSRTIKADDISLQILSNNLSQRRNNILRHRLTNAIDTKGRKLIETTDAEENMASRQEDADNAFISNLSLADQVKYSTINLNLYQRQEVRKILVANEKNIKSFEPGFGHRILEALQTGWDGCEDVLLFLTRIWWLIIAAIAAIVIYRGPWRKPRKSGQ